MKNRKMKQKYPKQKEKKMRFLKLMEIKWGMSKTKSKRSYLKIKNTKTRQTEPKYCLKVKVNDKVLTLRKSKLCCLFSDKAGTLSSKIHQKDVFQVKKPRKINVFK